MRFIDEVFENYDMTEEDKQFIRHWIDKTNFFPGGDENDVDFTVEEVNVDLPSEKEDVDNVVYVKTIPALSREKPLHPRKRLRQKVKLRKRKEKYR